MSKRVQKHKKLEEEVQHHQVVIDKVIESGAKLLEDPKYGKEVVANTANLTSVWEALLTSAKDKGATLAALLRAQEFFFEVSGNHIFFSTHFNYLVLGC